ncbi:MAG: phosphoenolpyruvate carboxykinase (ATP) [Planctomycetaceae bacterium]|nr:phosphoenolpyruvate carboxykinase (ATP) [Planctomycetaceae bacterium]
MFSVPKTFNLASHGITVENVFRNLAPSTLYEEAIRHEPGTSISDAGCLIAYSGEKTGRSPKDKRVVRHPDSQDNVWWGPVNFALDEMTFSINRERAIDYLNTRDRIYCVDAYAGWEPNTRLKVRVICARPYHALFMHNMLIRPTDAELETFEEPDFVIFNAGAFPANRFTTGMTSRTSVDLSIEHGEVVLLGTEYAGEMKKAVFTYMNYLLPMKGILSMHCSATTSKDDGTSSVLFGLSGTGKTTLSADPNRYLIGDDEHGWSDDGIFNIEGGCYAKAVYLTRESEPEIFDALRFGAVLENVVYDKAHHHVDFNDTSITQNTRGSYPIEFMGNAKIPCVATHPSDVIFLTCDAFGVLPPVARLTKEQAMYYFISGYTAKVAGTEMGVTEPEATFSPCFGGPFLVCHPSRYAQLLAEKIDRHGAAVWLVNTGWSGGAYGVGSRMPLRFTRSIVDAIHSGELRNAPTERDDILGLDVVSQCPGVPAEMMVPRLSWRDTDAYEKTARKLAGLFRSNFEAYAAQVAGEVTAAGPQG